MGDTSESSNDASEKRHSVTMETQKLPFNIINLTMGGPSSAFSSLPLNGSSSLADSYRDQAHTEKAHLFKDFARSRPMEESCLPSLFPVRQDFTSDIPIAPAFAQIFQRRRRRENRPRRQRTTFTSDQTLKLELEYNRAEYITRPRRFELAEMLSLTESQIKIWFQNRRAKDKRIEKAHVDHHMRTMGYGAIPAPYSLPVSYQTMCGACLVPPPTSLPPNALAYNTALAVKPFKL